MFHFSLVKYTSLLPIVENVLAPCFHARVGYYHGLIQYDVCSCSACVTESTTQPSTITTKGITIHTKFVPVVTTTTTPGMARSSLLSHNLHSLPRTSASMDFSPPLHISLVFVSLCCFLFFSSTFSFQLFLIFFLSISGFLANSPVRVG